MTAFARYIGIDYSGARTPNASLKGLRIYRAEGNAPPVEGSPAAIAPKILDTAGYRRMAGQADG